jgi:hypothetical protein
VDVAATNAGAQTANTPGIEQSTQSFTGQMISFLQSRQRDTLNTCHGMALAAGQSPTPPV